MSNFLLLKRPRLRVIEPSAVRLTSYDGRPAYFFRAGRGSASCMQTQGSSRMFSHRN